MAHVRSAWPPEALTVLTPTGGVDPGQPRPPLFRRRRRRLPSAAQIEEIFETVLEGSRLPWLVGAQPLARAAFGAEADGTLHLRRGAAHLTLRPCEGGYLLRGTNADRAVRVRAELLGLAEGWREIFAEIEEFDRREDLESNVPARRRRAVRIHAGGTRILRELERSAEPKRGTTILRVNTRRIEADGTWEEEEETLVRADGRAKLDTVRRCSDGRIPLACEYPWLIASAYSRAHERISKWVAP